MALLTLLLPPHTLMELADERGKNGRTLAKVTGVCYKDPRGPSTARRRDLLVVVIPTGNDQVSLGRVVSQSKGSGCCSCLFGLLRLPIDISGAFASDSSESEDGSIGNGGTVGTETLLSDGSGWGLSSDSSDSSASRLRTSLRTAGPDRSGDCGLGRKTSSGVIKFSVWPKVCGVPTKEPEGHISSIRVGHSLNCRGSTDGTSGPALMEGTGLSF